jgi:hypothetical protein
VTTARTLSAAALYCEIAGVSGTLEVDVRKYRRTGTNIQSIAHQYSGSINSISLAGSGNSTQSISNAMTTQNTQSITFWKAAINVQSIIAAQGTNLWQYNLASSPDSDWAVGDYVTFASCTTGVNNGTFQIVSINNDGGNNIVVTNASGAAQTGVAGTSTLQAMSYNLTNPAPADLVAGEQAVFASHTTGANNGTLTIYKTNQGGNNVIVKNQTGATQGGVAGTIDSAHWKYVFSSSASSDLVVSEFANCASHSTGANNGNFRIVAVNSGGNNVIVYNTAGVAQGGVAGTVNSNRWVYALASDPSSSFTAGDRFVAASTTSGLNSGTFTVVQVNRSATNNLVVANTSGVAQGGAAGTVVHTKKVVAFLTDQSALYATNSRVIIFNTPDTSYVFTNEFPVVQVNRGGGSNYNIVIDNPSGTAQSSPCGNVAIESRSVFSTRPTITVMSMMQNANNAVLDASEKVVGAGLMLAAELLQVPAGTPQNINIHVS